MATVQRLPTNGTEGPGEKAVSQGEFHGIPVGQSPPQASLLQAQKRVQAEHVIAGQHEHRMEPGAGAGGIGTPVMVREAHTATTATATTGAAPGRIMPRPGSAGRLSSASATPRSLSEAGGGSRLRGAARSPNAAGLTTFGHKYMPFAAGFAHMADTAPVYRSTSLGPMGPTAAVTDDVSFYYRLDSGHREPGELGEHVRNTRAAARSASGRGGFWGRFTGTIE